MDAPPPATLEAALSPGLSQVALAEARKAAENDCLRVFTFAEDERTFEARVAPAIDGWSVMVVSDATAALELARQLEGTLSREVITDLAGGAAHDFNNLLTVVRGYAELIASDPSASESVREDVKVIIQSVERASELTSQLLEFSRPRPSKMEVMDVTRTVSDIERMLRALIPGSISLSIS
ncbi:MAG: signal transduction histidine kinase, partial [Bradymonadia bacterium]